jgi:hypothetical protein
MSQTAWISLTPIDPNRVLFMQHAMGDDEAITCQKRDDAGESLGQECYPSEIWTTEAALRDYAKLPPIFYVQSCWVVTGPTAKVLRQFDLGGGALYPVKLLKMDRSTPIDGEFFCLNIGNVKQAFLPGESRGTVPWPGNRWHPDFVVNDDDIAVSGAALSPPDIWIDPLIVRTFFLSDALGEALRAAKIAKAFMLSSCRVVAA